MTTLLVGIYFLGLVLTTQWLYAATYEHPLLDLGKLANGEGAAPEQYRIWAPLLYSGLMPLVGDPRQASELVQVLGIVCCWAATGLLFLRTSGSLDLMMLGQLALLGAFGYGMVWRTNQEFFEVAVVSLSLLLSQRRPIPWLLLGLLTVVGSMNRETHVCVLFALAAVFLLDPEADSRARLRRLGGLAVLGVIYASIMIATRIHFGLRDYHTPFWMWRANLDNLADLGHPRNILFLGAGLGVAFILSLWHGNRTHLRFVLAYAAALLGASFLASSWGEHRVMYPLMAIMIASLLGFHAPQRSAPPRDAVADS